MIKLLLILSFLPSIGFTQNRLPNFPTYNHWIIPEQSLFYPEVKRIIYLESSFVEDSPDIKLKYDIYYDKGKINIVKFLDSKTDSTFMIFSFDKYSRIIREDRLRKGFIEKTTYTYDEKKLKSIKIQFDQNLSITKKTEAFYNKQYQLIKMVELTGDSKPLCSWTYEYNCFGDLIKEVFLNIPDEKGNIQVPATSYLSIKPQIQPNYTKIYLVSYDSLRRPVTKTEYKNSQKSIRTNYFYSGDSSITKTIYYFRYSGVIRPRRIETSIRHDSINILILQGLQVPDSSKIQTEHTSILVNNNLKESSEKGPNYSGKSFFNTVTLYDLHHNWVKKTTSEKSRIIKILERKITY